MHSQKRIQKHLLVFKGTIELRSNFHAMCTEVATGKPNAFMLAPVPRGQGHGY